MADRSPDRDLIARWIDDASGFDKDISPSVADTLPCCTAAPHCYTRPDRSKHVSRLSRPRGSGAAGRFWMEDEARGGLDPLRDRPRPHRGRRGRGPYARDSRESDEPRTTYAALDLGTNNCR